VVVALFIIHAEVSRLTEKDSSDVLKGTSLDIYRLLLKTRKPLGIREVQRALNLSSPSVAQYHLVKLEQAGLLKREAGNYVVNKVILEHCVKISRFLIPRYLFYSVFAAVVLLIELTFLKPDDISREYFFSTAATAIFVIIFCYETAKVWLKGRL
jgi:DNA-binding transcriptional ArsR family regulator